MVLLRFARWVVALYVSWRNWAPNKKGRISSRVTIAALPDDVLLEVFDFYREVTANQPNLWPVAWPRLSWPWNRLVHVCQRWRVLVFASPLRLRLCLRCKYETPVKEMLDVWPPLPLEIIFPGFHWQIGSNIIAALEHRDRICRIWISHISSSMEAILMPLGPFPALEALDLHSSGPSSPAVPDAFLGGSAPRLQTLSLCGIPFPGLPRILLSASELVNLELEYVLDASYISSEAMITALAGSTRLRSLVIKFASPLSHPPRGSQHPPPRTRTRVVLPALAKMVFRGVSEYLDVLMSGIYAPQLYHLDISLFDPFIFDIPQLSQFIGHAGVLRSCKLAELRFCHAYVTIVLSDQERSLCFTVPCNGSERRVWSMAQICDHFSFLLSIVEQLGLPGDSDFLELEATRQVDPQWLKIFRAFTAVRTLRISVPLHRPVLQELTGESATDMLPYLDSLHIDKYPPLVPDRQAIELFIAARRRSGHPVTVYR